MCKARLVLDALCSILCLCAAVLSTMHDSNDGGGSNTNNPTTASLVTCLWSFLFFLYGTCTVFDLQPKHNPLPIAVDIMSLLLLVPSVAFIWIEYNPTLHSTQFHFCGNHPSLLRIGIFTGANVLRFFISTLCCCDHTPMQRTTAGVGVHGGWLVAWATGCTRWCRIDGVLLGSPDQSQLFKIKHRFHYNLHWMIGGLTKLWKSTRFRT